MKKNNKAKGSKVLIISDLQLPFAHRDALEFCKAVAKAEKPDHIIQIGDLIDIHSTSDYTADPDGMSPGDELAATIKELKKWYAAFPEVTVTLGNHDIRYYKAAFNARIPSHVLKSFPEMLQSPKGWSFVEELDIDGVKYVHGDQSTGISATAQIALAKAYGQPTVFGHMHVGAGIIFYANKQSLIYSFNVGCLIDTKAYAFNYSKKLVAKPILGVGLVSSGVPKFIPMLIDSRGRWTGVV